MSVTPESTMAMRRVNEPIDRVARRVLVGGYSYQPAKEFTGTLSHAPLPCKPLDRPSDRDFTGYVTGHLVVIGLSVDSRKGKSRLWVCRCVCGYYTVRRSSSLVKRGRRHTQRCSACEQSARLRVRNSERELARLAGLPIQLRQIISLRQNSCPAPVERAS